MGQLVFQAALGGQVNLVGPNTASTFNLNVPAASDTLVGRATTDTLTNKTLTSPVVSGGTIDNVVIGGTTAVAGSFTTVTASTSVTAPFLTSAASTSLLLKSAGTTAVTIDTSQNVGIGTSSTNYKMSVNGIGNFYSGVAGLGRMFLGDPADPSGYIGLYRSTLGPANSTTAGNGLNFASIDGYTFNTGSAAFGAQQERMRIDSSGKLMARTTSAKTYTGNTVIVAQGEARPNGARGSF